MASSFQKKARTKVPQIPGTKPSLHKNQLLVSTGVPSLDACIGGGLAVGTVLLVEEDHYGSYSKLLLKYFLAEGVVNKHGVFVSSGDTHPQQILKELPFPIFDEPVVAEDEKASQDTDMKIAWRYQHLPEIQSTQSSSKFGHYYDVSKTMDAQMVDDANATLVDVQCLQCEQCKTSTLRDPYSSVLRSINKCIRDGGYSTATETPHRNILRIGIHSLGSPQWDENGGMLPDDSFDPSLCRFLYGLRALLRSAYASCLVTVPTHLFQSEGLVKRIESFCDTVVKIDSFVGSDKEKNPAYKDYHGLFHCVKLPRLNSLTSHMPDTLDLAFKLRRKKFTIERLHLPPELSDTASRSQEDPVVPKAPALGCGSLPGSKLDF